MGLKENFSQAVKDLTGNSRDDDKKRNSQYEGLKRALDNDQSPASDMSFSEGTSQPYYRSRDDGNDRAPQNNPQYNGQPRNANDGYRGNDRNYSERSYNDRNYNDNYRNGGRDERDYDDGRRMDNYSGRDGGYYDNNNNRRDGYYDSQRRDGYYGDNRDRGYGYNQPSGRDTDNGYQQGRDYNDSDRSQQGRDYDYNRGQSRDFAGQDRGFGGDPRDRADNGGYNQNRGQGDRQESFNRSYNNDYNNNNAPKNTYPAAVPQNQNGRRDYRDAADNEITVISRNTMIDGNVRSLANMSIDGDIKGDVETTKDIELNGRIVGNMTCNNANMITSQVQGNLMLKGSVEIGRDTLLIGDLNSGFASINGKVKGNVEIAGKAEFKADAVIFGDISASTITVDDGAIIQGYVSTTFLNKDESEKIFPEFVEIGE